ncbi:MAG: PAS domain-containing sensor histidine kinase [Gammaproteobacteria bacterium]|nr:PAS domain-containing sensor histidine kinase [Gammaproteobacteria bacterium]
MTNNIILAPDENVKIFLEKATAYNAIASAVAIFDSNGILVYQNDAYNRICKKINKQTPDYSDTSAASQNQHIIDELHKCISSRSSITKNIQITFNSKISLEVNLTLRPVIDSEDNARLIMLTIAEESVDSTFLKRVQTQEKYNKLVNQIKNLSETGLHKNELIKTLLKKTPFAIIIFDDNQQVIQANEAAKRAFTLRLNEITGMHCTSLFDCHKQNGNCPVLNNYSATFKDEISSCDKATVESTFLRQSSAIKFNGKPAVLEAFVDISEKITYEQELVKAIVSADLANASKSEFLSNMSHELRTPLHSILSFSRFGIDKINSPQEKILGYFEKIQISGKTLLKLLNDLLDLSKLEAGKMDIKLAPASLELCCTQVIDEFLELSDEKNLTIISDFNSKKAIASLDHERIKQVIRNLIGNAVKFSPNNEIIVISTFVKNKYVYFCIDDKGPGIPGDELENVFDKFVQSSKTKTGAGGTGLGLSICKEIILRHNGQIWAAKSSQGGRFLFKLRKIN